MTSWSDLGLGAAGQTVGVAKGAIIIDTSSLNTARTAVIAFANTSQAQLGKVNTAVTGLQRTLKGFNLGGLALGGLVTSGLAAAQRVKQLEILFRTLAGSQKKANEQMAELRKLADETGQPFIATLEAARNLYPAIRGTNAELAKTVNIANKLAILDPAQGVEGAAFALREFVNGEYRPLVTRFELSREKLKEIRDEYANDTAGMLNALNAYIAESTGLTDEAMTQAGKEGLAAFQQTKEEVLLLLAEGFTPLLNEGVLPALKFLREFLRGMRDKYPDVVKFAAAVAAIGAAGSIAARGLPMLGIGGIPGAGKVAGVGVAAYGGYELGVAGSRLLSQAGIGDPQVGEMSQDEAKGLLGTRLKQVLIIFLGALADAGDTLVDLGGILKIAGYTLQNGLETVGAILETGGIILQLALMKLVLALGTAADDLIPDSIQGNLLDPLLEAAKGLTPEGYGTGAFDERLQALFEKINQGLGVTEEQAQKVAEANTKGHEAVQDFRESIFDLGVDIGVITERTSLLEGVAGRLQAAIDKARSSAEGLPTEDFTQEQIDGFIEMQEAIKAIDGQAAEDRLAAQEDYLESVKQLEADYAQDLLTMQEDEAIRRRRAEARLADDIREAMDNRQRVERQSYEAYQERSAQLIAEAQQTELDAQEEFNRRRSRMNRDYQLELLKAAASLSGSRVRDLMSRHQTQTADANTDFQIAKQARQRQLADQLADEQKAHEARLEAAREAEAMRIADLQTSFEEAERLQAEDRQRRLEQMAQEHQEQLQRLVIQKQERLAEIDKRAREEKAREEANYRTLFNKLAQEAGQHQSRMLGIQRQGQAEAEASLRAWWQRQKAMFTTTGSAVQPGRTGGPQPFPGTTTTSSRPRPNLSGVLGFATGTRNIIASGVYALHQGEGILNPMNNRLLQNMLGGPVTPAAVAGMAGSGGPTLSIGNFSPTLQFGDVGNRSNAELMQLIKQGTKAALTEVLKGYMGKA